MPQILIIRHAQAKGNSKQTLMGSSKTANDSLSQKGMLAAHAKAKELQAVGFVPNKIYTSELTRTNQTAAILKREIGVSATITKLPELNERSFGQYEGQPYEQVIAAFEAYGKNPPTVEKVSDFVERVLRGFEFIKEQPSATTLIVTHSNPLAVIRCALYHPHKLQQFWEFEDDDYLEGLLYEY